MKFSEYIRCDATALSVHVASGAVSPDELLKCALEQSARANPKTNAICLSMESQARKQLTDRPQGPFAGVPFLIKDAVQDYAGLPTSYGSKSMLRLTPQQHCAVVQRYLNAGHLRQDQPARIRPEVSH